MICDRCLKELTHEEWPWQWRLIDNYKLVTIHDKCYDEINSLSNVLKDLERKYAKEKRPRKV
jgi:hypothetical protein